MKKKIGNIILATLLLITSLLTTKPIEAIADQSATYENGTTKFEDMKYEHIDYDQMKNILNKIKDIINKKEAIDKLQQAVGQYIEIYNKLCTMDRIVYILYSRDITNSYYNEEYNYCHKLLLEIDTEYYSLFQNTFGTDYENVVEKVLGDEEFAIAKQYAESNATLNAKEKEAMITLIDKYHGLKETVKIKVKGKSVNGYQLENMKEKISESQYERYEKSWKRAYKNAYATILKKVVVLGNQIAKSNGYNTYAEYTYEKIYGRDYTPQQVEQLHDYVKKYIAPVYQSIFDKLVKNYKTYEQINEKSYDDMKCLQKILSTISPDFKAPFDYMKQYNLVYLGTKDTQMDSCYTTVITGYNEPYIFISKDQCIEDINSLIHEFGHFYNQYCNPSNTVDNLDICELDSQGLELLSMNGYHTILSSDKEVKFMKQYMVWQSLNALIGGCVEDEFQQELYKNPNITTKQIDKLHTRICNAYNYDSYDFSDVPHTIEVPFYYISYGVSVVPALELWEQTLQDNDKAYDTYSNIIKYGPELSFQKLLDQSGLSKPFDEKTIKELADNISSRIIGCKVQK